MRRNQTATTPTLPPNVTLDFPMPRLTVVSTMEYGVSAYTPGFPSGDSRYKLVLTGDRSDLRRMLCALLDALNAAEDAR